MSGLTAQQISTRLHRLAERIEADLQSPQSIMRAHDAMLLRALAARLDPPNPNDPLSRLVAAPFPDAEREP